MECNDRGLFGDSCKTITLHHYPIFPERNGLQINTCIIIFIIHYNVKKYLYTNSSFFSFSYMGRAQLSFSRGNICESNNAIIPAKVYSLHPTSYY